MTEELRLWSVGKVGEVEPKVERLAPLQQFPTELAFEDLLVQNPEMLEPDLKLVGRQTPTQTGRLDLLAIDRDGRLVVYELKRARLAREAVTQVLDYASDLDAMSVTDLAEHIAQRSGNDGIQEIDKFEQWYSENFGGDDLSRLLPPRMVLIGLGVDPAAERMVRFISGGPVDLSVVTFRVFKRAEEQFLARQVEVEPEPRGPRRRHRSATVSEKRMALREYLTRNGYQDLFDRVHSDLCQPLPDFGVWEEPGSRGIGIQLSEPNDRGVFKTYFGVQAGYLGAVCSVSILPQAIRWGAEALERFGEAVKLSDWPHGGKAFAFASKEEWAKLRPDVLELVKAVMANRLGTGEEET